MGACEYVQEGEKLRKLGDREGNGGRNLGALIGLI